MEYDAASAGNHLLGNQWPRGWGCHIFITSLEDISHGMSKKKRSYQQKRRLKKRKYK